MCEISNSCVNGVQSWYFPNKPYLIRVLVARVFILRRPFWTSESLSFDKLHYIGRDNTTKTSVSFLGIPPNSCY